MPIVHEDAGSGDPHLKRRPADSARVSKGEDPYIDYTRVSKGEGKGEGDLT